MDLISTMSSLSFDDIHVLDATSQANFLLEYQMAFESICENSVLKRLLEPFYGRALDEVYQKFEEIKNEFTSIYFFFSDFVQFYPMCRTHQSKSFFVDDLGNTIYSGQFYYYYRPLLWNVSKQVSYVLKRPLKVEVESGEFLPSSFLQFEELENHILYSNEEPYSTLKRHYELGLALKKLGR